MYLFSLFMEEGIKWILFLQMSTIFTLFRTRCESPGDRTWPFDYKSTPEVMMGVLTTDNPWASLWLLKCFVTCNIKIKQAKDVYPETCPTWQNCGHGGQLLLKLHVFIVSQHSGYENVLALGIYFLPLHRMTQMLLIFSTQSK